MNIREFANNMVLVNLTEIDSDFFKMECTAGSKIEDIFLQVDNKGHIVILNENKVEQFRITNLNLPLSSVLSGWISGMCSFSEVEEDNSKKITR